MEAGHPFRTDELDELRSAQRRVLRWMPDWLIDRHAPHGRLFTSMPDADRTPLEYELRGRAADLIDNHADVFGRCVAYGRASITVDSLTHGARPMGEEDQVRVEWTLTQATAERDASSFGEAQAAELKALSRFIFLAVIADELAGDYHDPRLRTS